MQGKSVGRVGSCIFRSRDDASVVVGAGGGTELWRLSGVLMFIQHSRPTRAATITPTTAPVPGTPSACGRTAIDAARTLSPCAHWTMAPSKPREASIERTEEYDKFIEELQVYHEKRGSVSCSRVIAVRTY
jgi:hypothetical protein